jgi:hypothetical protein
MVQCIAHSFGGWAAGWQLVQLRLEPGAHFGYQRAAFGLPDGKPLGWTFSTHPVLTQADQFRVEFFDFICVVGTIFTQIMSLRESESGYVRPISTTSFPVAPFVILIEM